MDISKIKERIGVTDESYDFLQTNEHLNDNIVLLGFGGSRAYGTNLPTSDIDVRGIAIRTAEDICLMRDFEQVVDVTTDTTIYSLDKMFSLLSECNPNTIEMLGLRPQDYIYVSDIGQQILDNKRIFFTPSLNDGVYVLTIFDLTNVESTSLLNKMTKHFHLTMQQEPLALAA